MNSLKKKSGFMAAAEDFWTNCALSIRNTFCIVAVIFFVLGAIALLEGVVLGGIVLMAVNALLILLMFKLNKKADSRFDKEFDEMVRRNKGE